MGLLFNLLCLLKFWAQRFYPNMFISSLIRQNIFLVLRDFQGLVQVLIPQDEVIEDFPTITESLFNAVVRVV